MAKTLDIAVKVQDAASTPLGKITRSLNKASKAAEKASASFAGLDKQLGRSSNKFTGVSNSFGKTDNSIKQDSKSIKGSLGRVENKIFELTKTTKKNFTKTNQALNRTANAFKKVGAASQKTTKGVQRVEKSTAKANKGMGNFSRTLISTTAFMGTFAFAARRLGDSMLQGAKMDRVVDQFEKAVGPSGQFMDAIRETTTNTIDMMEAMRSGIALRSLGLASDMGDVTSLVSKAGTAAKMAGLESGKGIEKFTQFLKSGSTSHLEFLNLLRSTDESLIMTESLLSKHGGSMGKVLTVSNRMSLARELLAKATQNNLKANRDYLDVLFDLQQTFKFAGKEAFNFVTESLKPILDTITSITHTTFKYIKSIREADKHTAFLGRTVITTTAAFTGLVAAIGTFKLASMTLGHVGVSLGAVVGILGTAGTIFLGLTSKADTFRQKLEVMGAVLKGTYQLVSSFVGNVDNFNKGIGEIDKTTADLLRKHNLFGFVKNISKVTSQATIFVKDFAQGFKDSVSTIIDSVSTVTNKIMTLMGIGSGPGSRKMLDFTQNLGESLGKAVPVALSLLGAYKGIKGIGGLLGNIPVIGKMMSRKTGGGANQGPKGTTSDPLYVRMKGKIGGGLSGIVSRRTTTGGAAGTTSSIKNAVLSMLGSPMNILKGGFSKIGGLLKRFGALSKISTKMVARLGLLGAAVSMFKGAIEGIADNLTTFKSSLEALTFSIQSMIKGFLESDIVQGAKESLNKTGETLVGWFNKTGNFLSESASNILDKMGMTEEQKQTTKNAAKAIAIAGKEVLTNLDGATREVVNRAAGGAREYTAGVAQEKAQPIIASLKKGDLKGTTTADRFQSQEGLKMQLTEVQRGLEGERKERFVTAFTEAQTKMSEEGKTITPDEFENIMKKTLGIAVDKVKKPVDEMNQKTEKKSKPIHKLREGGC